jgi:SHS2 domain-containing protein
VGGFALLEHTADVGISATGATLEDALAWLAKGMFSLIVDPTTVAGQESRDFSIASSNKESLAVDWLNELLYSYEATQFLPCEYSISLNEHSSELKAICQGERQDPERHRILTVVKAATYHAVQVCDGSEWCVRVFLDV